MAQSSSTEDELLGVTLAGRYWIISSLGVGGMGVAYRAWDEQQGLPVVIKIPKRSFFDDPKFAERFRREITVLEGLSHHSVVPIVDVGEHDDLPFVVMKFLPGGSLSNRRLRDDAGNPRPNPPEMLHLWLPAVADALDYIHGQGVIHRDVKPANVFFDAFWGAFVGDFGIAKVLEESDVFDRGETLTGTNVGLGTPEYMAPEQFAPKAELDGRADQYALAVMVYEMVSGSRPFKGENAHVVVEVLTQAAPSLAERRPGLPPTLVAAVHRGLSKASGERFATCQEFASAVLADVPRMADEPGVARLLCPQCNRILKLPEQAAGRQGSCPKCKGRMMVAADLGALWLVNEEQHGAADDGSAGSEPADGANVVEDDPLSSSRPRSNTIKLSTTSRPRAGRRRRAGRTMAPWLVGLGASLAVIVFAGLTASELAPWSGAANRVWDPGLSERTQLLVRQGCEFSSANREYRFPVRVPRMKGGAGVLEVIVGHSIDDSGDRGMYCELLAADGKQVFRTRARQNGNAVFRADVQENTKWTIVVTDHDTSNGNWATVEAWLVPK